MKKFLTLDFFSNLIVFIIMALVVAVLFIDAKEIQKANIANEEKNMVEIISKALVQCYALEGNYPAEIQYLEKYGIMFDETKYFYYYEPFGEEVPMIKIFRVDGLDVEEEYTEIVGEI